MEIFTIYYNPTDYPGKYVARRFNPGPDPEPLAVGSLEEVRAAVPKGLVFMPRFPLDDPCIVETWL